MGVSAPTGNGEKRGIESAGTPGTPLPSRPARAKANDAKAQFITGVVPENSADGAIDMKADPIR